MSSAFALPLAALGVGGAFVAGFVGSGRRLP